MSGALSAPLLMLMSEAFSVFLYTLIKLCYTKALEWSSLVCGPEAKSLEIMNPTLIIVNSQGSCHLQTVRVLLLFQSWFLLFPFILWLLWLGLRKLCGIVVVRVGHPCLVPDFRGNAFNILLLRIMFTVDLSYVAFIMLKYCPSMPACWRVLS